MTVATEASYAEFVYTGAETAFHRGLFRAVGGACHMVGYFDSSGLLVRADRGRALFRRA
jgi:hypothetical protein